MNATLQTRKLSALALPWPVDWTDLFGLERTCILEIGFGSGIFLRHLASAHPNASIIGLEISNQSLVKAERAIVRQKLANVRVIHSRAETALAHLFEPASLSQVHINFPDPWFKRGHEHRRLMQRDTLDAIVSRMQPGAELYLATDIFDYAEMSAELLADTPGLVNLLPSAWASAMPGRVMTKYEARALAEGRSCHYFAYQRNDEPAPPVPVVREVPMPHLVFATPLSLDEMRAAFKPFHAHDGAIHVGFMEAYTGRKALLFEIHVSEPTIEQHTGLMLVPHDAGEYTLQLSTLGHPRPTQGMQVAVRALGEWLVTLSPGARLVQASFSGS
ncbi:MAG TPA: tRNA (guanosine(46)-N7)-methyltransferase TrmB [Candidatus Limnocylindrales bacterium]|nr:tRNA (guanosine(46)-N7)-methyltransferase TrmB [Candidatus Limnocylindrales bacterium]